MIHYPFDDDPPPRREMPAGTFESWHGPATPRRGECIPTRDRKVKRIDVVIVMAIRCGVSKSQIAQTLGLSKRMVFYAASRHYNEVWDTVPDTALSKSFESLSKKQRIILLAKLIINAGLPVNFTCATLKIRRQTIDDHRRKA